MKNRFVAALLAFFLGSLGINNFYTGHNKEGIIDCLVSILLCWTGIAPLIISVINLVRACKYIWCNSDEEFCAKYVINGQNK